MIIPYLRASFQETYEKNTRAPCLDGGTYGYLITSNVYGYSDKSIFLPGNPAEYWSSDLDVYNHNCALKGDGTSDYRYNSRVIRPVYGKKAVTPPDGSGTLTDPFSTKQACNLVMSLEINEKIYGVYTHGYVTSISEISEAYGNATYTISDINHLYDLTVYRGRALGNTNFSQANSIAVGDEVVIYGDLVNFYGTPEYNANNYIAVLNGNQ